MKRWSNEDDSAARIATSNARASLTQEVIQKGFVAGMYSETVPGETGNHGWHGGNSMN